MWESSYFSNKELNNSNIYIYMCVHIYTHVLVYVSVIYACVGEGVYMKYRVGKK